MPDLHASLDFPLPDELEVGAGTAVFVAGTCFCPQAPIRSLELLVAGEVQRVRAFAMPRLDFFRTLHPRLDPYASARLARDPDSEADPLLRSYRSGFWGIASIRPGPVRCELALRAQLDGAGVATVSLATLRCPEAAAASVIAGATHRGSVAICMATFEPPRELFARQVESIREQSLRDWTCYISDDRSSDHGFAVIEDVVGDDPRFVVSRSARRGGFYRNFERALRMVPEEVELIALSDQDDRWHPDKLATLMARLGGAQLVYSDARIVARDGTLLAGSYWDKRANNHTDLVSLLVANSVTGAAALMRRAVLDAALPFPPAQFSHYHDHWLALVALALGEIAFVERALYDYVQHGDASLGHAAATRMTPLHDRLAHQRPPRERVRMWRLHYFSDVCRLLQVATILELRCGERMSAPKRRALRRFLAADEHLSALAWMWFRGARELLRARPQTLGAEWMLFHALGWRRLLALTVRDRPQRRLRLDAVPPAAIRSEPARAGLPHVAGELAAKIAPLELAVADDSPRRLNLLIPTIDLDHFYAGYSAKFNLAHALARQGVRVRVLTTDPVGALAPSWKRTVESYAGLEGLFERVELEFGRGPVPVEVSPSDGFIATSWWTAHIAADALRALSRGGERFVYLIQEYEPFTFPMGSHAALAAATYELEHFALFSTELLRQYFCRHRIGVYKEGEAVGAGRSVSFQNAIVAVDPPGAAALAARSSRRLLFYARPEPHAARNMFELGVLALSRAVATGSLSGWELRGAGGRTSGSLELGRGHSLALLPRSDERHYRELLREHDVGLALMYTPHPSLVPLEMAAAGMLTVTNTFENKTAAALTAISSNLIAVEPTVEAIEAGVLEAVDAASDYERRARGAAVDWSTSWEQSFSAPLLARVAEAAGWERARVGAGAGASG